jgi:predicted DNA-binding ribbon-helix-helix protein
LYFATKYSVAVEGGSVFDQLKIPLRGIVCGCGGNRILPKGGKRMKSLVVKRSIVIAGHKTSVSLEEPFWLGLKAIAEGQQMTLSTMVGDIDTKRQQGNLSSAIRLFVLDSLRARASSMNQGRGQNAA